MKTVNLIVSIFLGLVINSGVFAQGPSNDCEILDLDSITYIEEENEFELGFNTYDYLPSDFDPHKMYVDLRAIKFIEDDEELVLDFHSYLPADFDAYAYPANFRTINYLDPADEFCLDFDTAEFLPEGFDPYSRNEDLKTIAL